MVQGIGYRLQATTSYNREILKHHSLFQLTRSRKTIASPKIFVVREKTHGLTCVVIYLILLQNSFTPKP